MPFKENKLFKFKVESTSTQIDRIARTLVAESV